MRRLEHWQVLDSREVYSADPWIRVYRQTVRLPGGRVVDDYHHIRLPDCVIVYAETGDERVIVERQYKHGSGDVGLSLPAGAIDEGEDPLASAQRELLEETGFAAKEWRKLGRFAVNGNYGCGFAHLFAASGASRVAEPNSRDLEDLEVLLLSREELKAAIGQGRIHLLGAATTIALALQRPG